MWQRGWEFLIGQISLWSLRLHLIPRTERMKGIKMHRDLRPERWLGGQEHMPTFNSDKNIHTHKINAFFKKNDIGRRGLDDLQ